MHGYLGRILRVDLNRGELWDEPLNEDYARLDQLGRQVWSMVDPEDSMWGWKPK